MSASAFLDTNILLYAISTAPEEATKKARARELIARNDYALSVQVLQEFYVNATRRPRPALSHEAATAAVRELAHAPVVAIDMALMNRALELRARHRVSYWDACIIAAARASGAAVLYSEDLSHGQDYEGVRVENPFLSGVREPRPRRAYGRRRPSTAR
jgi:predicted nucleic acid-binding protein